MSAIANRRLPFALAWSGVIVSALAILLATLTPAAESSLMRGGFLCLWCGSAPLANVIRNVILFLPLGFFAYGVRPSVVVAVVVGAALSGAVELLQFLVPGRNPLLMDVVANTMGAGLGASVAAGLPSVLGSTGPFRSRLFAITVIAAALIAAAPAWLLTPAPPRHMLYVHWNHPLTRSGAYDGAILEAAMGDLPLRPGRVPDEARLPDRFLDGHTLRLRLEVGTRSPGPRGLFRVVSGPSGQELLTLTVHDADVAASLPLRADRAGLTRPGFVAPGVLVGLTPGDTVLLGATLRHDGGLRVDGPAGQWLGRGVDTSMGWSLLYFPSRIRSAGVAALGFMWCAFLLFGPTLLAPGRAARVTAGVGLVTLMGALPVLVPFVAPLPAAGWLGAATGWVGGRLARDWLDHTSSARVSPR